MRVPSDTFTVHVKRSTGTARLRLTGRFDAAAVATLDALIGVVRDRDVTMDLEGVTAMDGAGWRGMLTYERQVHDWGKDVRLENAPEHVRRIFELTAPGHLLAEAVGSARHGVRGVLDRPEDRGTTGPDRATDRPAARVSGAG